MTEVRIVGMIEDGVRVESNAGVVTVPWAELEAGHYLIENEQSFNLGIRVGAHIASLMAANDE